MLKKNKVEGRFFYRTIALFSQHPWLLLIALVLAVLTWLYVRGELISMEY
ncbi:MAG: hypothetical protein WBE75_06055 [Candidatus Omnitrophota bacterium]